MLWSAFFVLQLIQTNLTERMSLSYVQARGGFMPMDLLIEGVLRITECLI